MCFDLSLAHTKRSHLSMVGGALRHLGLQYTLYLFIYLKSINMNLNDIILVSNTTFVSCEFVGHTFRQELAQIAGEFYDKYRMPNTIGCIDGTHIIIKAPSEEEPLYVNRKQLHSLNVQVNEINMTYPFYK